MKHIKCDIEWLKEPEHRSYASDPAAQAALTEVEADAKRRRDELQFIQHRLEQPPIDWPSLRTLFWLLAGMTALAFGVLYFGTAHAEWTAPKYDCKPKTQEEYRIGHAGPLALSIWYCDLPTMIKVNYYEGDPDNIPDLIVTPSIAKIGDYLQQSLTRPGSPEGQALLQKIHEQQGIKIVVAPLTGSKDRPSYHRNANNTKGSPTGKRVKAGSECGWYRLQDTTGKATMYFQVAHVVDEYTLCEVKGLVTK